AIIDSSEDSNTGENIEVDENEIQETNVSETNTETVSRHRGSYTIDKKLKVLEILDKNDGNVSLTSKQTKISRTCIIRWRDSKRNLLDMKKERNFNLERKRNVRSDQSCKRPKHPILEKQLKTWFEDQRRNGLSVGYNDLTSKAREIFQKTKERSEFKASNGWLERFLKRNNISMRQATSIGQKIPANASELARSFLKFINDYKEKNSTNDIIFANMDEVPIWFDMPHCRSYDIKGSKNIKIKTTGNEKLRITVVLTAFSDGRKCIPMIVFKGLKNVPRCSFPCDVYVTVAQKGTINSDLMKEFNQNVWKIRPNGIFANRNVPGGIKTLLVMDSFRAHKTDEVKKSLKNFYNTDVCIVPGGMTPILQPADVCYNRSFKSKLKELWSSWMAEQVKNNEPDQKIKKATYATVAEWVKEAWMSIKKDQIINSFKTCGVFNEQDENIYHDRLRSLLTKGTFQEYYEIHTEITEETDCDDN
ncbi:pogo transposable element with KRAB domain-like protein, partial [Dinothrombium tinctorium]